jgi:hypothetical protein
MTPTLSQWKTTMEELIDGVQGELNSTVPAGETALLKVDTSGD